MKYPILFSIFIICYNILGAQSSFKKEFFFNESDTIFPCEYVDLIQFDQYYFSIGFTDLGDNYIKSMFITKHDNNGNRIDQKSFFIGEDVYQHIHINQKPKIVPTSDSTFAIALVGLMYESTYLFHFSKNLNLKWHKKIELKNNDKTMCPNGLTFDGQNIYLGIFSSINNLMTNYVRTRIIKYDINGNELWNKYHSDLSILWDLKYDEVRKELIQSGSFNINKEQYSNKIIYSDTSLNVLSYYEKVDTNYKDFAYQFMTDNKYDEYISSSYYFSPAPPHAVWGTTKVYGLNLYKRDRELNTIWKKPIWPGEDVFEGFSTIKSSDNNNFYVFANVFSYAYDIADKAAGDSIPLLTSYILKFNFDGDLIWSRKDTFGFDPLRNNASGQIGGMIVKEDGGCMVNGYCVVPLYENGIYSGQIHKGWLMSLDKNGCIEGERCATSGYFDPIETPSVKFNIYPNPNNGIFKIEIDQKIKNLEDIQVTILNHLGDEQESINLKNERIKEINISNLKKGVYYVRLKSNNKILSVGKVISL